MTTAPFNIPGIYRQDVLPQPRPILPTGVPVFIGVVAPPAAALGPQRLTHWPQFDQLKSSTSPLLAAAVHGFFANGGTLCYVVAHPKTESGALDAALTAGLESAAEISDVDLVCVPELTVLALERADRLRLQQLVLDHCDRTHDRFALLDTPLVELPSQIDQMRPQGLNGRNGALYGSWIRPETGSWVPPCGHVAGLIARCDRTTGVHCAPANQALEDALDLSLRLTEDDLRRLAPAEGGAVNCLRTLPGRGIRGWGVRTLSADPQARYVSGRRLLITVARWAALTLATVAFEPNDLGLWIRIEREFTAYLEALARQGALQGDSAAAAFYVKCDGETNPPEVRDRGEVVIHLGLAPIVPGEFIEVRLIHGETGVVLATAP